MIVHQVHMILLSTYDSMKDMQTSNINANIKNKSKLTYLLIMMRYI